MEWGVITPIASSVIAAGLTYLLTRGKLRAETESIVTATYNRLVTDLRVEIDRLKEQVKELEDREQHDHRQFEEERKTLHRKIASLEEANQELIMQNMKLRKELEDLKLKIQI
jgi:hypothetical protein